MLRTVIKIDEDLCDGCGLCVDACHEGAIGLVDGKAHLLRDDYCDGLGDCLPACPTGAITFEEREAEPYDEEAVKAHLQAKAEKIKSFKESEGQGANTATETPSRLMQWPTQIKLMPVQAPYYDKADLLIAADCAAFAYADFHTRFMEGKITLIGCPKLDSIDYSEKLTEIIRENDIKSLTVARMEVPCCGGIEFASEQAIQNSGKDIPFEVITLSVDGEVL